MSKYNFSLFLISTLLILCVSSRAQPSSIQWQYSYGGSNNEEASNMVRTSDGGYIIAGYASSVDGDVSVHLGGEDFWILKLDSNGLYEWDQVFGGSNYDVPTSVIQTSDGGYAVAGYTWSVDDDIVFGSNHGMDDYWIIRLDNNGGLIWKQIFGGSGTDEASSIIQTSDGGFLIGGSSSSIDYDVSGNHGGLDYWIVKTDANGSLQWQKSLGGSDDDYATSVVETAGGNYMVAGYTFSNDQDVSGNHGYNDYWLVKLSNTGNMLWQKTYGGSSDDRVYSMIKANDDGFALAGRTYSNDGDVTGSHGSGDYWIMKVDSAGILQWQKSYGGSGYDEATSIIQTGDSGYAIAGKSFSSDGDATSNNGGSDFWIVKTDSAGNIQWQRSAGGSNDEKAPHIVQQPDGSYVIAGTSLSNDKDVSGNHGLTDYWIIKFAATVGIDEQSAGEKNISIFPNPASGRFEVWGLRFAVNARLELFDVLGKKVLTEQLQTSKQPQTSNLKPQTYAIDISSIPSGLYFLRFISENGVIEKKIIVER